jgi:phosphohistidine phosphatase
MKIYLVRHGESLPSEINPEHPLSPEGFKGVEKITHLLAMRSFPLSRILYSQKLRAKQTAEILGEHIAPDVKLEEHANLNPNDPIEPISTLIEAENEDLMIVGHLPFLNKLVGKLLVGDENRVLVNFQGGTTVCLEGVNGNWIIRWVVGPDQI